MNKILAPQAPLICGEDQSRIIGGHSITMIPWQVSLQIKGSPIPFCGGVLISERHVLTAAHCMMFIKDLDNIDVMVGKYKTISFSGTRHTVCRAVNHRLFDDSNYDYDFSILHLNEQVEIGPGAVLACLPDLNFEGDFLEGKNLTVSGWGELSDHGIPTFLQAVSVPGIATNTCQNAYYKFHDQVTNSMLCAGFLTGGADSCQGDSGGTILLLCYVLSGFAKIILIYEVKDIFISS